MKKEIEIIVDSTSLDKVIEKTERLAKLLQEVQQAINSFSSLEKLELICQELVFIRKELQTIRSSMELNSEINIDAKKLTRAVQKAIGDTTLKDECSW